MMRFIFKRMIDAYLTDFSGQLLKQAIEAKSDGHLEVARNLTFLAAAMNRVTGAPK